VIIPAPSFLLMRVWGWRGFPLCSSSSDQLTNMLPLWSVKWPSLKSKWMGIRNLSFPLFLFSGCFSQMQGKMSAIEPRCALLLSCPLMIAPFFSFRLLSSPPPGPTVHEGSLQRGVRFPPVASRCLTREAKLRTAPFPSVP